MLALFIFNKFLYLKHLSSEQHSYFRGLTSDAHSTPRRPSQAAVALFSQGWGWGGLSGGKDTTQYPPEGLALQAGLPELLLINSWVDIPSWLQYSHVWPQRTVAKEWAGSQVRRQLKDCSLPYVTWGAQDLPAGELLGSMTVTNNSG